VLRPTGSRSPHPRPESMYTNFGWRLTRFEVWICKLPFASIGVRATKFRKVGREGAAWYASKNEAVGLGRDAPSSSNLCLPADRLVRLQIPPIPPTKIAFGHAAPPTRPMRSGRDACSACWREPSVRMRRKPPEHIIAACEENLQNRLRPATGAVVTPAARQAWRAPCRKWESARVRKLVS
jgi:hypothetical protein